MYSYCCYSPQYLLLLVNKTLVTPLLLGRPVADVGYGQWVAIDVTEMSQVRCSGITNLVIDIQVQLYMSHLHKRFTGDEF